jgi:glutaryl-CoA dehydrogenase
MTQVTSAHLGESLGTDFFSVREQFTEEQWEHFVTVRRFVDEEVVPVVGPYWERAEICWPLVKRLPELGIVGEDIKGYGCAEMSPMACGLVTMELHRGDGSLGVFLGVHAGLAMLSIAMCGSEEQKARWLPDMAQMNKLGAFALTEPEHGSDSVALETSARPDGDSWVLNGRKRWIGLGSADSMPVTEPCPSWAAARARPRAGYQVMRAVPTGVGTKTSLTGPSWTYRAPEPSPRRGRTWPGSRRSASSRRARRE